MMNIIEVALIMGTSTLIFSAGILAAHIDHKREDAERRFPING